MEQNTNASGVIHFFRGFLGLLLSSILIILLIFNGFLIPMKTSFLKGSTTGELLENLGFYELIRAAMAEEFDNSYYSTGISHELYDIFFTEETISDICDAAVTSITEGEAVDLSFLEKDMADTIKSEVNGTIEDAFDEIDSSHKVIDANVLSSNTALNSFKDAYGVNISEIIMDSITAQYGVDSINLDYIDINTVKDFVDDSVETAIYPEIDTAVSEIVSETADSINEELEDIIQSTGAQTEFAQFELVLNYFKFIIIAILVVIAVIMIIQIIMYHSCLYRAFRNFSISSLLPGLLIAGFGFLANLAFPIALEEVTAEVDNTAIVDFIDNLFSPFLKQFTNLGLIYLAAFVVCLIISIILKASYKSKHTIQY